MRVPVGDLAVNASRIFPFRRDAFPYQGIAVRHAEGFSVFVNRCPHVTYTLDLGDGRLWDRDQRYLLCSSHGALFEPATGSCLWGPPAGLALEALPFEVDGDDLVVTIPPEPDDWP